MTKATIGKSNRFDGGTQCILTYASDCPKIDTTPDFAVTAALYDGLNAALSPDYHNVATSHGYYNMSFTCVSGNCTWAEYTSLGVRSTCFDVSSHLKRTSLEDVDNTTGSAVRARSSTDSGSGTAFEETYLVPQSTADPTAISDTSTAKSMVASVQSTVTKATAQSSFSTEAPTYAGVPLLTDLTAFSDVSTLNSEVAPIRSTASQATVSLQERAYSSSIVPPQSSATRTSWALGNLTLANAAVVADPDLTINFKTSQALLAAFTVIRTDNNQTLGSAAWNGADASAMECGLELTLNVYDSSVVNNVLVEHILASTSQKKPKSWLPSPNVSQTVYHPNGLPVDPGTQQSNPIYHHTFLWREDYALDPAALQSNVTGDFTLPQRTLLSTLNFLTSLI
ncbi:hypothetical protein E4T49_06893 [Aureobasidium sp. EXF-10728]|nr:hypothetical protein E4T49_06893 [Aureobasidium sp. EXF-10728]